MKSPRTFPRLVMKEWPVGQPLENGRLEVTSLETGKGQSYAIKDGKIIENFTRVVKQTGLLKSDSDKIAE